MAESDVDLNVQFVKNFNLSPYFNDFSELINAYRSLRNYCATGTNAQLYIRQHSELFNKTKELLKDFLSSKCQDLCFLVSLQFIANFLVENRDNQVFVWRQFSDTLKQCLNYPEPKIRHCSCMIFYNIFLDNHDILRDLNGPFTEIISLTQNELTSEYSVFILELFICQTNYITQNYEQLPVRDRLILLSVIESIQGDEEGRKFHDSMLPFLSQYFVKKAQRILTVSDSEIEEMEAREAAQVLNIINSIASSNERYLKEIQEIEELLLTGIGMLSTVHNISKEKGNQFSMLLKIAELEAQPSQEIEGHPGFGFKAALVRLVGNMCWKNRRHQDTARDMDAIPLILDCSNIDARNPLIIQWAVLAMRNLCDGNLENQRVVACVDRNGRVDTSRLADLGLALNGSKS